MKSSLTEGDDGTAWPCDPYINKNKHQYVRKFQFCNYLNSVTREKKQAARVGEGSNELLIESYIKHKDMGKLINFHLLKHREVNRN